MKKSQLRKIVRESIKGLMTEQSFSYPGKMCTLEKCDYNYSFGGKCIPDSVPNAVGDSIIFTWVQSPMGTNYVDYYNYQGHKFFIKTSGAPCNAINNGVPIVVIPNTDLGPQGCPRCCNPSHWGIAWNPQVIPGGACFTACSVNPTCDQTPTSACATQGFGNNASNFTNFMSNKNCSNYQAVSNHLENQANTIMQGAPTPEQGPYNNWNDIKNAANASGLTGSNKGKFKRKAAKGRYALCMNQECNC